MFGDKSTITVTITNLYDTYSTLLYFQVASQRHFSTGYFLRDNSPGGNFPNVQFSKRGSFPKVRLGLQRRCKLPGRNINLWQIPEHYRSSQLDKDADWFIQKSYSANHQNCCFCICWQLLQKWLINLVLGQFSLNKKKKF